MLQAPKPNPDQRFRWYEIGLGILNANVLAAFLMSIVLSSLPGVYFGTAATVIIPLLMGFLAGATWRKLGLGAKQTAMFALLNTFVGILCAFLVIKEGAVCLVMAAPLLFGLIWAGTGLGIAVFRPKDGNVPMAVTIVPLLLFAFIADCVHPSPAETRVVTTSMTVRAPAARVFPHTVAFPRIAAAPTFFLHGVGLPYPVETTAEGAFVGAERVCRFSDNIAIGERITALEPGRRVEFVITDQPEYPEFTQHGRLMKGEITVHDNGDGTATLTGTSWYTLQVHPSWYFGAWADEVIHAVHRRVFDHIRVLAEKT